MIRIFFLLPIICFFWSPGISQSRPDHEDKLEKKGFYVVVGAFAIPKNAEKYSGQLKKSGLEANVGFVEQHRLYYVYILFSEDAKLSNQEAAFLRSKPEFWDCWVYHSKAESDSITNNGSSSSETGINVVIDSATIEEHTAPSDSLKNLTENVNNQKNDPQPPSEIAEQPSGSNEVFLSLYNSTNDKVVEGTVSLVNSENSTLIDKVKGNTYAVLPDPGSLSRKLILLCDALGYRKVQHEVVYNSLLTDSTSSFVEDMGTALLVKFELIKYVKGDIRVLYSVYFYNDAAIMLPESKYELQQLKNMMIENPHYKIMLHGHTNGNYFGGFVTRTEDGDFFSIPKNAHNQKGSAKKLSLMRADIIRQYLIKEGIDGSRILAKGWGGKRPLYDKHSSSARRNVRVEVEILQD